MSVYNYIVYQSRTVSIIIPVYNDGVRISPVITAIRSSSLVDEIIIVDDGSDSHNRQILQSLTEVNLVKHPQNLGKSQAMKTGLLVARSEIVVFVDADLKNFTSSHLELLITAFVDGKYDMLLGDREKEPGYGRFLGIATALTGERVFLRQTLLDNLHLFEAQGYLIESAFNRFFFHHFPVGRVLLRRVGQTQKMFKNGPRLFVDGLAKDLHVMSSIIKYLGIFGTIDQIYTAKHLPCFSP